jgi:hypothetical protein
VQLGDEGTGGEVDQTCSAFFAHASGACLLTCDRMVGVPKASLVGGLAFLVSPLTRKALTFLRMRRAGANPAARFASTPGSARCC